MRTKPTIYQNKASLVQALPKSFATMAKINGDGPFGLIVARDKVVHMSDIEKILRKLPSECSLIIAARDLTIEAEGLLQQSGGRSITISNFGWTDKSHEEIKVSVGAKVKRPMS